ncbi:MFS transporter [Caballeronia sp. LZ028]|uniref:MFS transporter n=1 Tax=Caballeronia sp. LZ028 TaxID=3038563 RepID=UPI002859A2E0|nr:MFS transporter [Caballeronia sp. LZ028]MDR5769896.1 MFS transporter [Caballeronia sp. LZ028]
MQNSVHDNGAAIQQPKKAAASGWIGSTLEYYDFFIFATAASLIFPKLFFPSWNPAIAIIGSLAAYGVGYVARPIGAIVLGHIGDTFGRRSVLVLCMLFMGLSTVGVGLLPTYNQVGILAPILMVSLRLVQGFAVAGEISGSSSLSLEHAPFGERGFFASFTTQGVQAGQILAAAVFLPLEAFMSKESFLEWGWRVPFWLSALIIAMAWYIRREVGEAPAFANEARRGKTPKAPVVEAVRTSWPDLLRVICMAAMNVIPAVTTIFGAAYAVQPAYGIGFSPSLYLWISLLGNATAVLVIPFVGRLSDKVGRRPPVIVGSIVCGLLSFAYLYAISIKSMPLVVFLAIMMWGVAYQGFNAVFPSFFPELFPTRIRVSAMAISQNVGTAAAALLPALFAMVAPPGTRGIPIIVGGIALAVSSVAALAAYTARETYRVALEDLGDKHAVPAASEREPMPEAVRL